MIPRVAALVLLLPLAAPAAFAQRAGHVSHLVPAGTVVHQRKPAEAQVKQAVAWEDLLRTNVKGRMRVALDDGSFLTLGRQTEMRVVRHDTASQQTQLEMLYGRARVQVAKLTKPGSGFTLTTPTAVLGVIGSGFLVETRSAGAVSAISAEQLESLPASGGSLRSLLDLKPGAMPGENGPSIRDFDLVDATAVYGMDGITAVRNIEPAIDAVLFLLPGEAALIERGRPPVKFRWAEEEGPERLQQAALFPFDDCPGPMDISRLPDVPGAPTYRLAGRGTSSGEVFDLEIENPDPNCPVEVFIPMGAALRPKGFLKRALTGILAGSASPPLGDFQVMMVEGLYVEVPPGAVNGNAHIVSLRGYCMEMHKLAPRQNTEYRFDPGKTAEMAPHRRLVEEAQRLYLSGATRGHGFPRDSITQWALWAELEKMKQSDFAREYTKLVENNFKAQKRKIDKKLRQEIDSSAQTLWEQIQKVQAAAARSAATD
jgi:hypothetical protein